MKTSKAKVKILHIINGEFFSGAERVQDVLALSLPGYDYEVGFVCLKPVKFAANRVSTVPLYEVPMKSKFDLACVKEIAAIARRDQYAVIHSHTPRAVLLGRLAAWMAGLPLVHHVHSPTTRDTENLLRNCATSSSHYFDANDNAQLKAAFKEIAKRLQQIRIKQ